MSIFDVTLKKIVDDSYEIETGYDLTEKLISDLRSGLAGNIHKFAVVTDDIVRPLYADRICSLLTQAGYTASMFVIPAGEKSKTRQMKEFVEDAMLERGFRRDCMVIAVGGGVVTDLAGFVAGTFGRGVPFINYATTLLAAADASVGGKTAVDTPLATNLIGLFHQPKKVYIDIRAWETLDRRQLISGLSETIKHACMADAAFFTYLEQHLDDIFAFDTDVCTHIAETNCRIKYEVVQKDEKESGMREILNLGHTVGRAIETVSDYKLLHGEALAIGMAFQVTLGEKNGYLTTEERDRVISLYKRAGLPVNIPEYIDKEALVKKLYTDKKVRDGKLRFVFQKGIGEIKTFGADVFARPVSEDEVREVLFLM